MTRNVKNCRRRAARSGAVLVVVLVILAVISALLLVTLQTSLRQRRQHVRDTQKEQIRWILEAAIARAQQPGFELPQQPLTLSPAIQEATEVTIEYRQLNDDAEAPQLQIQVRLTDPLQLHMTVQETRIVAAPTPDPSSR